MLRMTPCNQHPAHFLMLFVSNARHSDIRKESHPLTVVVTLSNHQWYVRDFMIGTNIRHSDISFSLLTLVSLRIILLLLLLHCQDYTPKSSVVCQGLRDFMIWTNAKHSDMSLITQFHKLRKENYPLTLVVVKLSAVCQGSEPLWLGYGVIWSGGCWISPRLKTDHVTWMPISVLF